MWKKILISLTLGAFVLFTAVSCRQNNEEKSDAEQATTVETEQGGGVIKTDQKTDESAKLEGGVAVPAKRGNLTAADRAAFLRAIGLTDYADNSERFLEAYDFLKNAGISFQEMGDGKYLAEIITDQGAHATSSVYALYQETAPDKATAKLLEFTNYFTNHFDKNGELSNKNEIVKTTGKEFPGGAKFDKNSKVLTVTSYGRGTGGCGSQSKYKMTNDRPVIFEVREQECTNVNVEPENWKKIDFEKAESASGGVRDAGFSYMKPEHITVLKTWLAERKDNLHLAQYEYDSTSSQKYLSRDAPERDPFYAVGDFNNNGIEDFAVILDDENAEIEPQTKRQPNALAVFEMSPANKNGKPHAAFFSDQIDSLFIIHPSKKEVSIGSYPSDDGFYLVPKGDSYEVKALVDF